MVACEPDNYPCHSCSCDSEGRSPHGDRWKIPGVIDSDRCLRKLVTAEAAFFLDLYRHYQNGFLPSPGGMLDQPYGFFRAMGVIDQWVSNSGRRKSRN